MELVDRGFRPKQNYIEQWIQTPMPDDALTRFMNLDLKDTSLPTIPEDFDNNSTYLPSMVLQIVDAVDIGNSAHSLLGNLEADTPVRQVYKKKGNVQFPRHTLRWTLSDGYKQVSALEYETIPELDLLTPFGCKLLIKTCQVSHGILFLTPSDVTVYGGQVSSLYDGDMLATLEQRFNERLKMPAQVPPAEHELTWRRPASMDPISEAKKNGDFDKKMERITQDFAALDSQHKQAQSQFRAKSTYDASRDNATYDSFKHSSAYDSSKDSSARYGSSKDSAMYSASKGNVRYGASKDKVVFDSSKRNTTYDSSRDNAMYNSPKYNATYDSSKSRATYSSSKPRASYGSSKGNVTYDSSKDRAMYGSFKDNTTYSSSEPSAGSGSSKDNAANASPKPNQEDRISKETTRMELANFQFQKEPKHKQEN